MTPPVTASAHPNLALVKYWGRRDPALNLPANGSIAVNLSGGRTVTRVSFDATLSDDVVIINGREADPDAYERVAGHLDRIRVMAGVPLRAKVDSRNDFPMGAGVASSSSAFAALSLAATRALGLELGPRALSILARKGSGSACRSIPDGFAEWHAGESDATSFAESLAPADHWSLRVVTVTFKGARKRVSSLRGHRAAQSSPFYHARLAQLPKTLRSVRSAILSRDFAALGTHVEREAMSMHCVAMTSRIAGQPRLSGLYYWRPETMQLIRLVQRWRRDGLAVYLTMDAGPSVHLLVEIDALGALQRKLDLVLGSSAWGTMVSRPAQGAWVMLPGEAAESPGA
jgi:diphosphomevalonate decarboxylase